MFLFSRLALSLVWICVCICLAESLSWIIIPSSSFFNLCCSLMYCHSAFLSSSSSCSFSSLVVVRLSTMEPIEETNPPSCPSVNNFEIQLIVPPFRFDIRYHPWHDEP